MKFGSRDPSSDKAKELPAAGAEVVVLDGAVGLELGTEGSGGERVQRLARGARVVKFFNTTVANNTAEPRYDGQP